MSRERSSSLSVEENAPWAPSGIAGQGEAGGGQSGGVGAPGHLPGPPPQAREGEGGGGRRIWLCADDYGMAPGVNAAICDLIAQRRINATSVMVVAPSLDPAAVRSLEAARAGTRAAVGLHLTLTAPFAPLAAGFLPLPQGRFPPLGAMLARGLLRRLDPASVKREVAAQLARFEQLFGHPPDYVDGHQHVHLLPTVREAVLSAARRRAPTPWVRQCGSVRAFADRLRDPKALFLDTLSASLRRRSAAAGVATNSAFAGTYAFRADADFATLFPRFLDRLPDGGLIMCHPGFVDAELERLDPLTRLREREYAYLAGQEFPQRLAQAGVVLR